MRYKFKKHRIGDERIIKKFLLVPKTINNELRWLEKAEYKEIFLTISGFPQGYWTEYEWIN